jgi:hypothetical protein
MFLMQFDHEMFKGFPVSIPRTVFMAEIKVISQPLLIYYAQKPVPIFSLVVCCIS